MTSSSSSSTSNPIPKWNFHVFLSFRGEDTRKGFTDHLYVALCRKGIKAFRDYEELERGEVISQKLLQAIEGSLFAIVVLSKNYASSSWCLDELQKIIASRKEVGHQVFPIFYGVDPSDVRHQKKSFAQAFIKHEERFGEDKEKVQKWRDSLIEVANLAGWDSRDQSEAKLIEKGTEKIQGIVLHFNSHEAYSDREAFSKMINLRLLLITCNLSLPYGLKCLSSGLKVLRWNAYPLDDFPLGIQLDELAYLQMHRSKIKQLWDGRQCFENLKYMDLSHSKCLLKTPNFVGVSNLERLILEDCIGLVEVHSSLGQLKKLLVVNLKGCKNLKILPRKFEMDSLKEFVLFGCNEVKKLPEFGENMENLEILDLQEIGIVKLPDSISFLTSMKVLNLKGCKNLVCLPHTMHNLKHLKILNISGCSKFSKLPQNLNENEDLEEFDASGTAIVEVPSSFGLLEKLKILSFHQCKRTTSNSSWILRLPMKISQRHLFPESLILPPSIFNMKSLTELDISYCNIDGGFIPDDLGGLSSLQYLNLSGNKFVILPASISNLKSLKELNLSYCNIDEGFIPDDLDGLSSLQILDLRGNEFVNIPACFSNLLKLQYLYLDFCPRLQSFPHPAPNLYKEGPYEWASLEPLSNQQLLDLFSLYYQNEEEEEDKSEEENKDKNEEENEMCCEAKKQGPAILGESSTRVFTDDSSFRNKG